MEIGLAGTACAIELEVIKETEKAYQVCSLLGNQMWFPKSAFNSSGILNDYGRKLYEEKHKAIELESQLDKPSFFTDELNYIKDEQIREWTIKAIKSLPNYIFKIPASSTGDYHPQYALGEGGLIRHEKAAVKIAINLFRLYSFNEEEQDYIVSCLILHDGAKNGFNGSQYTVHNHPILICDHLRKQEFFNEIAQAELICEGIVSHMGRWNVNKRSKVVLPLPETEIQHFVHLCDYLASRKCLEVNFEVKEELI
jgi:hypothetical protein